MNTNRSILAAALTLLVGACSSPGEIYTSAEAPKDLKLDMAKSEIDVRFAAGSAALAPADAARLRQIAASGKIAPADRVLVAVAGPPALAAQRLASISAQLQPYGIVVVGTHLSRVPPEHGVLEVTRTLVTLPACPNWSKSPNYDFGNQPSSNFGCANQSNFGMMVAYPTDIANGLPVGASAGQPGAAAINRYMTDKVVLPTANTALPIATQSQAAPGNSGSTGSP